jgi:uncharacterized protein (DUF433 family)
MADPRRAFGRPVIHGTSVPIEDIRSTFDLGDGVDELAHDFNGEREAIEESLRATKQVARTVQAFVDDS